MQHLDKYWVLKNVTWVSKRQTVLYIGNFKYDSHNSESDNTSTHIQHTKQHRQTQTHLKQKHRHKQ